MTMSVAESGPPAGGSPQPLTADDSSTIPASARRRPRCRITAPQPGSLYDIMHDHAGDSLYKLPVCWTDQHVDLLGIRFLPQAPMVTPVPSHLPGRARLPSDVARKLNAELHTLLSFDGTLLHASHIGRAIKSVMATLFPDTLSRPVAGLDMDLYFGRRTHKNAVRIPCFWTRVRGPDSRESADSPSPGHPMLAYVNPACLAALRANLFRVVTGPMGRTNHSVLNLQRLWSGKLVPADPERDAYFVGILLAMAQAQFYHTSSTPPSSAPSQPTRFDRRKTPIAPVPRPFHDVTVHLLTNGTGPSDPFFIVYKAVVTEAFLNRFLHPARPPFAGQTACHGGIDVSYTKVPIWPLLGLKERLAKALGRHLTGQPVSDQPEHVSYDDLVADTAPSPSLKRPRPDRDPRPDGQHASYEGEPSSSSDERPALSPGAKRRRLARPINPLEVC